MTAPPRTTIAVGYYTRYYSREADLRTPRLRTTNPLNKLAERAGFEPAIPLRVHMISNHAPSATRSPLPLGEGTDTPKARTEQAGDAQCCGKGTVTPKIQVILRRYG